jgi:hypothetical protein
VRSKGVIINQIELRMGELWLFVEIVAMESVKAQHFVTGVANPRINQDHLPQSQLILHLQPCKLMFTKKQTILT